MTYFRNTNGVIVFNSSKLASCTWQQEKLALEGVECRLGSCTSDTYFPKRDPTLLPLIWTLGAMMLPSQSRLPLIPWTLHLRYAHRIATFLFSMSFCLPLFLNDLNPCIFFLMQHKTFMFKCWCPSHKCKGEEWVNWTYEYSKSQSTGRWQKV